MRHKWVGVLLQQLHLKKGVGVFSRVSLFLGDYGKRPLIAKGVACVIV